MQAEGSAYSPKELLDKGLVLPRPELVHVGREVLLANLSEGVVLHPFSRIEGAQTVLGPKVEVGLGGSAVVKNVKAGASAVLGKLGPVSLLNCSLGPNTVLGSGHVEDAVFLGQEEAFLGKENLGHASRVRRGSVFEENASMAQSGDTKMTILFPWVTLGSNLNWCDSLVTGGTGPKAFTEIGSGAVHFNFTPRGDKATASMVGNVVEGVFLDQERCFVAGNTSMVGPFQAPFGLRTAAGRRYAGKIPTKRAIPAKQNQSPPFKSASDKQAYVFFSQISFLAQLHALYAWYGHVRLPFAGKDFQRKALYSHAQALVQWNIAERVSQLEVFLELCQDPKLFSLWEKRKSQLEKAELLLSPPQAFSQYIEENHNQKSYTQTIQNLPQDLAKQGKDWLQELLNGLIPKESF